MSRSRSIALCALTVLSASAGAPAHAQDVARLTDEPLEEVVVSGQRFAQQRSVERKREQDRFVDVVSADDIGRLPDRNLAESLDRLAGISLTRDHGEGRFVAIRGLNSSLNNFTINGVAAGSPEAEGGGRRVPLDVIGGELLQAVEVVKVQTPDMDGQGIGGTINVVTAGPFDERRHATARVSLQAGFDELNSEQPYAGDFTMARIDAGGSWGWLLGAARSYRRSQVRGIYQEDWGRAATDDGASAVIPESSANGVYDRERRRTGINATLEWRPSAGDRYFLRGFLSQLEEDEERQRFADFFRNDPQSLTGTSGTAIGNHRDVDLRLERKDRRFLNVAIGGEKEIGEAWRLEAVAQVNDNEQEVRSRNWEWRGQDSGTGTWTVDSRGLVDVTAGTLLPVDLAGFAFQRLSARRHLTAEHGYTAGLSLRRLLGHEGSYLKAGVRYTRTDRDNDASDSTYAPGATGWTLADLGHPREVFSNQVDGIARAAILVDAADANAFFDANARSGDFFDLQEAETLAAQLEGDYAIDERVLAAYVMANWHFGAGSLIAGVRAERTQVHSRGFQLDFERAVGSRTMDEGGHMSVLPSVVARFDLTSQLLLRAAWTRTLGRPNYEQLAPISRLTRSGSAGLLEIGNPNLEARESANYDLALEWYFAPGGLLAVGAFRKHIENEILGRIRTFDDFVFDGETFERFTIATTENALASEVEGFEVSYQQQFDFLPVPFDGFGAALSHAALSSRSRVAARDDVLPLPRQPDWTRSATLFYQKADFELAIAMSKADRFLVEVADGSQADLYAGAYRRFDLRARYALADRYAVFFEWQNIDDEPAIEYQGGIERQMTQYEVHGQTWYVGFTARL